MKDRGRHSTTIAFLDFLFNLVLAFVSLLILLLLIAKMDSSPQTPENKNEFIIQAQWNDFADDDIDTWVMAPGNRIVGFTHREEPGLFLQKDDTGRTNKKVVSETGTVEDPKNFEVVNINKIVAGRYSVNLHLYRVDRRKQFEDPENEIVVVVKVMKVNPFLELPAVTVKFKRSDLGNEVTAINFEIDDEGNVIGTDAMPVQFATVPTFRASSGAYP